MCMSPSKHVHVAIEVASTGMHQEAPAAQRGRSQFSTRARALRMPSGIWQSWLQESAQVDRS